MTPPKTVWITRSAAQAAASAQAIMEAGFNVLIHPLVKLTPMHSCPPPPPMNAVLIFTSQNGVEAFGALTDRRHWRVITSGDATAARARALGFEDVTSAGGSSQDVKRLILARYRPGQDKFVHLGSAKARGDIARSLTAKGYAAVHTALYQAQMERRWPAAISAGQLDYIVFYSPMAAKALRQMTRPDLSRVSAVSISAAADAPLSGIGLKERRIAKAPSERALIEALLALRLKT